MTLKVKPVFKRLTCLIVSRQDDTYKDHVFAVNKAYVKISVQEKTS